MNSFIIYLSGATLATSFLGNSKILRGIGWLLTSILIATLYIAS